MKRLAAIILAVFTLNHATRAAEEVKYDVVLPPTCVNNLGEVVEFRQRSGGRLKLATGMANRDSEGLPFILRKNYEYSPPEFQTFIDHHECAHHQTGDVDRPHPMRNSPEHLMNESISDCVAIMRLRDDEAFAEEKLNAVIISMRTDMSKIGFPEISISSRISNLKNCYLKEESHSEFIKTVIKRRSEQ